MPASPYLKYLLWLFCSATFGTIITTIYSLTHVRSVTLMCCLFAVPLLSRVCPSDVCRIWKSGASLRVDATLLGFDNMTWIRGQRSYIFRGDGVCFCSVQCLLKEVESLSCIFVLFCVDSCAELMEVNHDDKVVDTERFNISQEMEDVTLESMQPAEQEVAKRLTTPIVNTYLDTKDISFER